MTPVKNIDEALITNLVVPRFMNYARYCTTSDRRVEDTPSTPEQWALAKVLEKELLGLGLEDVSLTDHCYVIARLPPSAGCENAPAVGFLAHMDTASDVSGRGVEPVLVKNYGGEKIELAGGLVLDPAAEPGLVSQKGSDIIHSGGTTLLGADDKAGIAEIMGAVDYLTGRREINRGPVEIIFSPDEETGKGLPCFPLEMLRSKVCYTLDGGPLGELEIECFNAFLATVEFSGRVIHVGAARGILANAALMAASYGALLPRSESPEATDGYYGYYCPIDIRGDLEKASLEILLRDFEKDGMERRLAALEAFARTVEAQFPGGKVKVEVKPQYYNMREKIEKQPEVLEMLLKAAKNTGIEVRLKPIRGGTDGSRLTELGIPTPNIFTGGRNFHSPTEWVSAREMVSACKLVIELIRLWSEVPGGVF
jgi:tripeptide aminopeptidase